MNLNIGYSERENIIAGDMFCKRCNKSKNGFRKKILQGFSTIPILLFVYLFGSGLNFTPILLTYSILLGLVLGIRNESIIDK